MLDINYNFEKIEALLKSIKLSKNKIKKIKYKIIIGDRFLKTHDETKKIFEKLSKTRKSKTVKTKIDNLLKPLDKQLATEIEKIDTKWDIVWNSNPENVQRMVKNWAFNNVSAYRDKDLEAMEDYLNLPIKTIIWIQIGLSHETTKKIANQICILFKYIDKWIDGDLESYSFYDEVDSRVTSIKSLLISEMGMEINDVIEKLVSDAEYRLEFINQSDVAKNVIENLIRKQRELDDLLRMENERILQRLQELKNRKILNEMMNEDAMFNEFKVLFDGNSDFNNLELVWEIMKENGITDISQMSDYDLVKAINKKIRERAITRKNSLDDLFALEREIRTPRFKLKKLDKQIVVEDDFDTLVLEKAVLR